jgi:RND family efflux transporter MFP subunit
LFDVADLSTLWVLADMYEKDLPLVRVGMKALVQVSAYADSFPGTINTIYGVVDEKTRTVKARVVVQNKGGKLKPEMFCSVKVQTALGKETIKIPAGALLGETEKHFVFVALNDTTFEKRDVRTGVETREFAEVLDGLLVGEKIVVKGGFFLKSELAKETFGEEH